MIVKFKNGARDVVNIGTRIVNEVRTNFRVTDRNMNKFIDIIMVCSIGLYLYTLVNP